MKRLSIAVSALALLGACDTESGSRFGQEAGAVPATAAFGTAVIENMNAHVNPEMARIHLAQRFAAEVDSTVTFDFNSAQLDAAARQILAVQANWIRQFPELRFSVYGHTDLVGSAAYNQRLGRARANAVVNYLVSQGISRGRLEALVSYGETRPLVETQGRERANRRTVTEVSGFAVVAGHDCCLNGQYAEIIFRDYVASAVPPQELIGIAGEEFRTEQ